MINDCQYLFALNDSFIPRTSFLHLDYLQLCIFEFMATRAKYTGVQVPTENNEQKLDTDIIMRFSDRYGTSVSTQENMFQEPLLSSSEKESLS